MENRMFCFQCQETFRNSGCVMAGMCGKKPEVAALMDELIRQLKIIALTCRPARETGRFIAQSLFLTITNANFDAERLAAQIARAESYAAAAVPAVGTGVLSTPDPDIRSLRELLAYGLKGIAAYAEHAAVLGKEDDKIYAFLFKALAAVAQDLSADELTAIVLEAGEIAVRAMALLDEANTGAYGNPEISTVRLGAGKRPGILISGHDLRDLAELLEQSKDAGVDVYTHGEMLSAHYYPAFKRYPHLYGNYGNAWHLQNREFAAFNGPVLMTTNCIVPVAEAYRHRLFTTGMAGWPGVPHIPDRQDGKPKDFSAIIAMARNCPPPSPLEEGEITGGFAHAQVLALADRILEAVRSGAIRQFVVMGGCDGRHASRQYYTEFARGLPPDAVILTAGCAKYRYNKLNLGAINGIPRVLDAGQCNDCYSLAVIAMKLRDAMGLASVNDLPLVFNIAWYEQKAVAVLLALLHLGFRNVHLGPTLPAFLSPNVAGILAEKFGLGGIIE